MTQISLYIDFLSVFTVHVQGRPACDINRYMPPQKKRKWGEWEEQTTHDELSKAGWWKQEESLLFLLLFQVLVHALRHVKRFLDFTDNKDSGKHLL